MQLDYSKLFDTARNLYAMPSYKSRTGKALMPLRYFFELTYLCNLQCPYCYLGQDRVKQELTTQQWFDVIDQIPFYSFVTLVGGEPLIRKDFIPILERTAKKTFGKLNVVTNGILITDEIIDAFIRTKMMLLSVSLDGYGENHDKNRAKEGIFDKIITNLENLNAKKGKNGKPMVDIKTIVLEDNLDDLPKLYKLCQDMNFDFLSISFLRNNDLKQNPN
jgi:MoaA/NifB/PqqE/SkfB family radical SAM enzyme